MAELDPRDPRGKTVLIVDDDESFLTLLEILVRRDGFRILLAHDGTEALEKLELKPDAVILDMMLPGAVSGLDILQRLRESKEKTPPVIVVTAYPRVREIAAIEDDDYVVHFMAKPVNQKKLLAAVHEVLKTSPPVRAGAQAA